MEHFRVSRQVANSIAERFEMTDYFKPQSGCYGKLSPLQQTQIFLWFAGHQTASFRDVADRFNITISSLYRIIRRFIYFLSNCSPQVIKWPT
jgi:DNA-binding MarR family transcriptional regulator